MASVTFEAGLFGKNAGNALDYKFANFGFSDSGSGSIRDSYSTDLGVVWGSVGYELGMRYDMAFGLTGTAHLDLGGLSGMLDYTENATRSTKAIVDGTTGAFIDLSNATIDASTFAVTPPSADDSYISIDMIAKLKADLFGSLDYHIDSLFGGDDGSTSFDVNIVDIDLSQDDIVKLTGADLAGGDNELYAFDLGIGELHIGLPLMEFEDAVAVDENDPLGALVSSATSEPFLTFEVDLDAFLLPVGNAFDYGLDFGPLSFGVDVGILDAKVVAAASLRQDVEWDPDVVVTMVTSLGETLDGSLGDVFAFTTPEGEGRFIVTATYLSSVMVTTTTSLVLSSSLDWKIGYGEAGIGIDFDIWQDEYKAEFALIEGSEPLGGELSFELTTSIDTYLAAPVIETYVVHYENFVTAASGEMLRMTTHQTTLDGGDIDNRVFGNALANTIAANAGNDLISAGAGDDRVSGGDGGDILAGGLGDDTLDGGMGYDWVSYSASKTAVRVDLARGIATGEGSDTLIAIDRVRGSAFDDTLIGNGNRALLAGGAGADIIIGGSDADGKMRDVASYRQSAQGVTVDLRTGNGKGGDAEGDVLTSINAVTGSAHSDTLIGNKAANILDGGDGADTIMSGGGADRIRIAATPTLVDGGAGRDTLLLDGGTISLTDANFINVEEVRITGDVTLDLTGLTARLVVEVDTHNGNGDVVIIGGAGKDVAHHRSGYFLFDGNDGDDILYAQSGVRFDGGAGFDTLYLSGTGELLVAIDRVERIVFDEVATANFAANSGSNIPGLTIEAPGGTITGDGGNDIIRFGDAGGTIAGGYGDDRIELGTGAETLRITNRNFGHDTVTGFDLAADSLDFRGSGVNETSVFLMATEGGTKLIYDTYMFGQSVSNSIVFVGLDYAAAWGHVDMVF